MVQKEIDGLLALETRLESKLQRAQKRSKKIPEISLDEARQASKILQDKANEKLLLFEKKLELETNNNIQKIQEKAQNEIEIIRSCNKDICALSKKTIHELLSEIE